MAKLAASLKAQDDLPYTDCFTAALAPASEATLVANDKDFERVGTRLKIICFEVAGCSGDLPLKFAARYWETQELWS